MVIKKTNSTNGKKASGKNNKKVSGNNSNNDSKRPLKRSMTGLETELHIIDNNGDISQKGYSLIKHVKKKYPHVEIVKECGMNMVELGCYPDVNSYNPALEMIESIQAVIAAAKHNNLKIYPFGTYPGKFEPKFTPDPRGHYKLKRKIFGEKFNLAVKAVGFHHHYALPKGVFDYEKKNLKLLMDGKLKRSLLNSYNFEIAIDPILTLFTQSSPFFEGSFLAKDSRMLIYRGGKKLKYTAGLYSNYQQIGALPPYKQTETDLLRSLKRRHQRWHRIIKTADPDANFNKMYPYKLDISWNPIKINKHGTIEERGMDMNYMSVLLGVSAMIKFTLKKIQHDFIEVIPADIGIKNSFSIKDGIMFVPPHTYVREELQKASAYVGYENDALYEYTKRFVRFAKSVMPDFYYPILARIEEMVKKKKSVSDEIISYAKRKNMISKNGKITPKSSRQIALHFSKLFEKDLIKTKKLVMDIAEVHLNSDESHE